MNSVPIEKKCVNFKGRGRTRTRAHTHTHTHTHTHATALPGALGDLVLCHSLEPWETVQVPGDPENDRGGN